MLFVVLHLMGLDADGELQVGEVSGFVGANYLLSVRSRTNLGFLNVRARCEQEPHLLKHGAGFVLYALMDAIVDHYFPVIAAREQELASLEEQMRTQRSAAREHIQSRYDLKRKLMLVQHSIGPLEEAVGKLIGGRAPQVCAGLREYYRDIYDHLGRVVRHVEAIRDMLNTAVQVNLRWWRWTIRPSPSSLPPTARCSRCRRCWRGCTG